MLVVSERTDHVVGLPDAVGGSGEPAGPTSLGVYESLRATLERVTGSPDVAGRRITISGLGQVGSRLAVRLAAEGAALTVTDVNPVKRDLADRARCGMGARRAKSTSSAPTSSCPPGIGGLLTDEVIDASTRRPCAVPRTIRSPLAAGADRLAGRGILYAPDFVVNAGGVIYLDLEAKQLGIARRDHGPRRRDRRHRPPHLRRGRGARSDSARAAEEPRRRAAQRGFARARDRLTSPRTAVARRIA